MYTVATILVFFGSNELTEEMLQEQIETRQRLQKSADPLVWDIYKGEVSYLKTLRVT